MSNLSWAPWIVAASLFFGPADAPETVAPDATKAAFDRFKALAGDWEERSSRGWTGSLSIRVIGRGSALLWTSIIAPHPGVDEGMATLMHLDLGRLILTHYCVAGNQPRLSATTIDAPGGRVEFTFLDATNLRSREAGHMDRVAFRIADRDHFTSRWTWYEKGQERWMEEIAYRRSR